MPMMTLSGASFLVLVAVWLPYLSLKSARKLGKGPLPMSRRGLFVQVIGTQAFLFIVGAGTAYKNHVPVWRLPGDPLVAWFAAAMFLALLLVTLKLRWSSRPEHSKRRLYDILPHDARELQIFALIALSAGVTEEIVYRGVLTTLVGWYTGSFLFAGFASAAVFGLSHAVQGWRAVITIFGIALLSQWIVSFTGSLIPVMVMHTTYDFIAGIVIPRWYVRDFGATSIQPDAAPAAGQ